MTSAKPQRYAILILLAAAITATLVLNYSQQQTRARITANQDAHALRLVTAVLPESGYENEPTRDVIMLSDPELPGSSLPLPAYRARTGDQAIATAVTAIAGNGYVGPIRLLIGLDIDGNIIRVRAIEHRETPGLGDRIEPGKSDWINLFDGLSANAGRPQQLRRDGGDFDQISGATITSRAVLETVQATQNYYLKNQTMINAPLQDGLTPRKTGE